MADADYRAWVEVLPEFQQFNQQVQAGVVGGMAGAGRAGSAAMGGAMVAGIGKFALPLVAAIGALGIGSAITDAVKTGIDAGINYIKSSIGLAAELEQNVGAVAAIFKDNADQIEGWSRKSAESVGLSRNSYLQFSSLVGAQLKNLGIPMDDVAGRTNNLIGLAADLSAQFGGSTSDAVGALSSLLRGERDPIERYGVSIKQADVNARIAKMGLGELTLEEEKQAGILATLAILSEQTADAQGTFADENETFLNVQQRMNAVLEDASAEFGEQLLPVMTDVLNFVKDELVPLWEDFNETLGPELSAALEDMWPDLKQLIETALPLMVKLLPVLIEFMHFLIDSFRNWARDTDTVLGNIMDLFSFLAGDITLEEFMERVGDGAGALHDFGIGIGTFVAEARRNFLSFANGVRENLLKVYGFLASIPKGVIQTLGNLGRTLYSSGRDLIQGFINGIRSMLRPVANAVGGIMDFVAGFFPHSPAERGPFSGAGWRAVRDAGAAIMAEFQAGLTPVAVPLSVPVISTGVASSVGAGGGRAPIYVQNPFTGEYLLAKVDGRIGAADHRNTITDIMGKQVR